MRIQIGMQRLTAVAALAAIGIAGAGCGDDEPSSDRAESPTAEATADPTPDPTSEGEDAGAAAVRVSVGEWFVKPARSESKARAINFEVENEGEVTHELEVVKTDAPQGGLPVADNKADVDAAGEAMGEVEDVGAGTEKQFTASLEPGNYVLICNLPTHYESGMHARFVVR